MENLLVKEMPISEVVSTLEMLARLGVTRNDLQLLRANPSYALLVANEIKSVRQKVVNHGWNHRTGDQAEEAFEDWQYTYEQVTVRMRVKRNFFVGFRTAVGYYGQDVALTPLVRHVIGSALTQMSSYPDVVKKSGYALPIRKIAALISADEILTQKTSQYGVVDVKQFAVSLGSNPINGWTNDQKRRFKQATLDTLGVK